MNVVITTIFPPTKGTRALAAQIQDVGGCLWIMGDRKGPDHYDLPATRFFHIDQQGQLPFRLARILPEKHYTRKNLGYLLVIANGAEFVVETDDDNIPLESFWKSRQRMLRCRSCAEPSGWFNAYRAFTHEAIWPRGYPLEFISKDLRSEEALLNASASEGESLIQQGLANGDPDVDAVYRMTRKLPIDFNVREPVRLEKNCWCPFNSQNTTFFGEAFPLLYLPSTCSFRMTDIWRSFVAQRCLWEMGSTIAFTAATVFQERNEHDLRRDFEQEVPGYLQNVNICDALTGLDLVTGRDARTVCANLRTCYEKLVSMGIVGKAELALLQAWIEDIFAILD